MEHFLDGLFELAARHHDAMAAATATDDEINANAQDLPFIGPAGMGFFHLYNITYIITDKISHQNSSFKRQIELYIII